MGCGLCGEVAHAARSVPVVFPSRSHFQSNAWDRFPSAHPKRHHRILAAEHRSPARGHNRLTAKLKTASTARWPRANSDSARGARDHHRHRRDGWRGRRCTGRLDCRPGRTCRLPCANHFGAGRRSANRYDHLLHRDLSRGCGPGSRQATGAGVDARSWRARHRAGLRIDGSRPRHPARTGDPGSNHVDRVHPPRLFDDRKNRPWRWSGRRPEINRSRQGRSEGVCAQRFCATGRGKRQRDQRGFVWRAGR